MLLLLFRCSKYEIADKDRKPATDTVHLAQVSKQQKSYYCHIPASSGHSQQMMTTNTPRTRYQKIYNSIYARHIKKSTPPGTAYLNKNIAGPPHQTKHFPSIACHTK